MPMITKRENRTVQTLFGPKEQVVETQIEIPRYKAPPKPPPVAAHDPRVPITWDNCVSCNRYRKLHNFISNLYNELPPERRYKEIEEHLRALLECF